MKKKYLSLLFTLAIMVVGLCLLPAKAQTANNETLASATADATLGADNETTLAPTAVDVRFTADNQTTFSLSLKDGEVGYVVANENKLISKWEETDAPSNNYVGLEYDIESATLKATFCNFVAAAELTSYTSHSIEFLSGDYKIEIELIGVNEMTNKNSACIKYANAGGMTITGEGSLALHIGTTDEPGSASGALWANGGNLVIKDTTMSFTINASATAKHHAILSGKGNVTMEGSKITVNTQGGQLAFLGTDNAKTGRYTLDESTDRHITVKDCEIDAQVRISVFESTNPAVISGTTMTVCKSSSSKPMFTPAPVFEGPYTAVAGLLKNKDKPDKLKVYDERKLGSYTYLSVVPYVVEQPTEPTVPETTAPEVTVPETTAPETLPEDTEPPAISGDINGDGVVNREDVILLLLHVTMPNRFPLDS